MKKGVEIRFGYWPRDWNLSAQGFQVEPLSEFSEVVNGIKASNRVVGKWLYPPLTPTYAPNLAPEARPSTHARSYSIAPTHVMRITSEADDRELGELAIALLGLLEGLRLIPEEWCHFYRAAIEPHTLSDLVCSKSEIEEVLGIAETFWRANQAIRISRCLFGAIHWFLFSQSYENDFEEFAAQYIVLDSCFRLHADI